jgi:hypothetical protein
MKILLGLKILRPASRQFVIAESPAPIAKNETFQPWNRPKLTKTKTKVINNLKHERKFLQSEIALKVSSKN